MDREARRAANAQMVVPMQAGKLWQEAATCAGIQTSRTTAYRRLAPGSHQGERHHWRTPVVSATGAPLAR